jgi:hypothetical protein
MQNYYHGVTSSSYQKNNDLKALKQEGSLAYLAFSLKPRKNRTV